MPYEMDELQYEAQDEMQSERPQTVSHQCPPVFDNLFNNRKENAKDSHGGNRTCQGEVD